MPSDTDLQVICALGAVVVVVVRWVVVVAFVVVRLVVVVVRFVVVVVRFVVVVIRFVVVVVRKVVAVVMRFVVVTVVVVMRLVVVAGFAVVTMRVVCLVVRLGAVERDVCTIVVRAARLVCNSVTGVVSAMVSVSAGFVFVTVFVSVCTDGVSGMDGFCSTGLVAAGSAEVTTTV